MIYDVIVIGGGASGLMAAVWAARQGSRVLILDRMKKLGKKILATGNGRCNYTNLHMDIDCFRSGQINLCKQVIECFDENNVIQFFSELGIHPKSRDGYIYPNSGQAASVLDVLLMELERLKIEVITDINVCVLKKNKQGFMVGDGPRMFSGRRVILTAGGKASPALGSDGSGYELAKKNGHRIITPVPALVGLHCQEKFFKQLAGIRHHGMVRLIIDGQEAARDVGELQLVGYGISGIPVFQVSRYAAFALEKGRDVRAELDFMTEMKEEELFCFLADRCRQLSERTPYNMMTGLFNRQLNTVLLERSGIKDKTAGQINKRSLHQLVRQIKTFSVKVSAANSFANAQACAGGVDLNQISEAMESRLVKGLYFAGEILDVDGICGGYNLQWAWSSGYIAGINAGRKTQ